MKNWNDKTAQHVIEKENQRHKQNYDHKIRCTQLGVGDIVLLMRTAFKGKHKIQDHWEDTVYHVEGQPYASLPVFKIIPVAGEGKVTIVHGNLLLQFGGKLKGVLRTRENADGSQDFTLAVSDDGVPGTEVVLTDPEPMGEGDVIHVQCVQNGEKPNHWDKTIWGWIKSLYWY